MGFFSWLVLKRVTMLFALFISLVDCFHYLKLGLIDKYEQQCNCCVVVEAEVCCTFSTLSFVLLTDNTVIDE